MIEFLNILGLKKEEIQSMVEMNNDIINGNVENANKNIETLKYFKCDNNSIKNIITSNPFYLTTPNEDIMELMCYFKKIELNNLNILFTTNPYILSLKGYEIKKFISNMINNFYSIQDICNEIYINPYIFQEAYN